MVNIQANYQSQIELQVYFNVKQTDTLSGLRWTSANVILSPADFLRRITYPVKSWVKTKRCIINIEFKLLINQVRFHKDLTPTL